MRDNVRKALAMFQALVMTTMYLLPLAVSDIDTPTGQFSLINVAPPDTTFPSGTGIQDDVANWDRTSNNTHMVYGDSPVLKWEEGTDQNADEIYTKLCIGTSSLTTGTLETTHGAQCDVTDKWVNASAIDAENYTITDSGFDYDGTSKTFYVALQGYDNTTFSANVVTYDIYVTNDQPDCSAITMTPTETHGDLSPALDWTVCTDADTAGNQDNYPADVLKYYVKVGDSQGDNARLTEADTGTTSGYSGAYDTDLIYNITEDTGWSNATYHWTVWADDQQGATNSNSSDKYGTFVLYDYLPDVTNVEITSAGDAYSDMDLDPTEGAKATVAVRITATDTDGDCSTVDSHYAYILICLNATAGEVCNVTTVDQTWEVEDETGSSGSSCVFVFTTNKTSVTGFPTFWVAPAVYKLYANVSTTGAYGADILRGTDAERDGTWTYNSLQGVEYNNTVNLGTLTMGVWNSGANLLIMNNSGNVKVDILWNCSEFNGTTYYDTTNLDSLSEFQIDDDSTSNETVETNLDPFTLNTTARTTTDEFPPSGGLDLCDDDACVADGQNTYWHMNLETGLTQDTYQNTINLETEVFD